MKQYILIGDSGHSKVITDCIESMGDKVIARLDDKYLEKNFIDGIIKGPIELISELLNDNRKVVISIGSNKIRKSISKKLNLPEKYWGIVKHKTAIISPTVKIGLGTVIMPGAIINANSTIGKHCIVNTASIIEHDNFIEDFVHISPNSTLTGGVKVAEGTQIGAASVVIPGIEVGAWSIVGAGSTVINNLPNNITAAGTPAIVFKKEGS